MSPAPHWRIKRIYEPADKADGTRVLVDRLWPRGLSREDAAIDLWLKSIAPSAQLRQWFGHKPERWDEFSRRYWQELAGNEDDLARLRALPAPVTLLYGARDTAHNQARALLDFLQDKKAHD